MRKTRPWRGCCLSSLSQDKDTDAYVKVEGCYDAAYSLSWKSDSARASGSETSDPDNRSRFCMADVVETSSYLSAVEKNAQKLRSANIHKSSLWRRILILAAFRTGVVDVHIVHNKNACFPPPLVLLRKEQASGTDEKITFSSVLLTLGKVQGSSHVSPQRRLYKEERRGGRS